MHGTNMKASEQVTSSSKRHNTYTRDEHPGSNSRSRHSNCFRPMP